MSLLHTDQPIRGDAESPDRLNREEYAKRVGRTLLLPKESPGLVISLEGPWGYGKTSVINLINKYFESLEPDTRPIVVNFNPWLISGADNLVQEFLVHLASSVGSSDRPAQAEDAARQLLSYSKVFTVLKYIPGAEPWATIIQNVIEGIGNATDAVGKLKEQNVDATRDRVIKAIKELDKTIVIFIDDIDRLPPEEVFAMIRLVKAVADFPRVTYVLAYDEAYISHALTHFGMNEANLYLDKIVQVRLHLPVVDTGDIETLVNEELRKMPEEALRDYFPDSDHRLPELYQDAIKYLLRSPRDVKRLFNRLLITETTVRGEVAFPDLFGLEVIALKAPSVYKHIRSNPSAYTGIPAGIPHLWEKPEEHLKKYEADRTTALNEVPPEDKQHISHLLASLFPLLDEEGLQNYHEAFATKGRIAATDRLSVALTYGVPRKEVSLTLVKEFLQSSGERQAIVDKICEDDLFDRFIELLQLTVDDFDITDLNQLLSLFSRLADSKFIKDLTLKPRDILLSENPVRRLWRLTEKLLRKTPPPERLKILSAISSDSRHLSLGTYGLIFCLRQHGFYGDAHKVSPERRWCTEEELSELKDFWLKSVKRLFLSKKLCRQNEKGNIIFLLPRLDKEMAISLCEDMMATDEDFDCLVSAFGETGRDSINGRLSHIEPDFLASIGGVEKIRDRARKRLESGKPVTTELRAMLQSTMTGKKYYLIDASEGRPF